MQCLIVDKSILFLLLYIILMVESVRPKVTSRTTTNRHNTQMDSFPILQLIISFIYDVHRDYMKRKVKPIQLAIQLT